MSSVDLTLNNLNPEQLKDMVDELNNQLEYQRYQSEVTNSSNRILEALSKGTGLAEVLNLQCQEAENLHPGMQASVLRLNKDTGQLFHLASGSIQKTYLEAINGVEIGADVGSCGASAFLNELVIVENINTHPNWAPFKHLALDAGLQACWSHPIHDGKGKVFGTFAMYYTEPQTPGQRDLEYIRAQARVAALVFEHTEIQEELRLHQEKLSDLVAEKTRKLEDSLTELQTTQKQLFEAEKYASLNEMVAGLAHEINTPLGIAVTSISMAKDRMQSAVSSFESGTLKKSDLQDCFDYVGESQTIGMNSLKRASEIVNDFKSVAVDIGSDENRNVELQGYIKEVMHTISPNYKRLPFKIHYKITEKIEIYTHPGSVFQVISNLVQNAIRHGFENRDSGEVLVSAWVPSDKAHVVIEVKDTGKGMSEDVAKNVFTPFFTTKRNQGGSGLGLAIVQNLVTQKLKGQLKLNTAPGQGSVFTILLPFTPLNSAKTN